MSIEAAHIWGIFEVVLVVGSMGTMAYSRNIASTEVQRGKGFYVCVAF